MNSGSVKMRHNRTHPKTGAGRAQGARIKSVPLKPRQVIPLLIIAAGLLAYHNSFQGPFIFDDLASIPENPHIRQFWPIHAPITSHRYYAVEGRPAVSLTLALNYALGGLNVRGYHVFNLIVHLMSTLALFGILRRTFAGEKLRDRFGLSRALPATSGSSRGFTTSGAAAPWLAAVIALIWEVHPLQTECVDYIVQRTESLMGLFLLLTLYCFIRGVEGSGSAGASPSKTQRIGWGQPTLHPTRLGTADATPASDRLGQPTLHRQGIGWFCLSVVSCALGMGSKEVMVAAPLIVLLYDRVFLASSFRELWQRRAGLYIGLAATWLLLALLVARTPRPMTRFGVEGLTSWDYLKTESGVILHYLRLCFWPSPLVIDYSDWPIALSLKNSFGSAAAVLALLAATIWAFYRRPALGVLGAWFFLILAPTSSFLPSAGEVAAERRMYLPSAAVITMVVVGAFEIGRWLFNGRWQAGRLPYKARQQGVVLGCVASVFVVVLLTVLTIHRNRDYSSELRIWQDAVEKRPHGSRAHNNLGFALVAQGRLQEAMKQYELSLQIDPTNSEAHNNLGTALLHEGRIADAIHEYQQAVQLRPDFAGAHYNLGIALQAAGQMPEATRHWEQVIRINPDLPDAYRNLGLALEAQGHLKEATRYFEQALRLNPDDAEACSNLGNVLLRDGNVQDAIARFRHALRLRPDLAGAHHNLAVALLEQDNVPEAVDHLQQTLRLKPHDAEAHIDLGAALVRLGRPQEAIPHYEQALRLNPDSVAAHFDLGIALLHEGNTREAIAQFQNALRLQPDFVPAQSKLSELHASP
jgi:tetratricopeptide (TPR) repeat protein